MNNTDIRLVTQLNEARLRRVEALPSAQTEIIAAYDSLFRAAFGESDQQITAREIELACGIPEHETMFWNHNGIVPASHVIREAFTGRAWLAQLLGDSSR